MVKKDKAIVDEKCKCGHLRSEHNDTLAIGHGDCKVCECFKFTWTGFIYKIEIK